MTTRTQITIVALSVLAIAMIPISAPQARRLPSRRRCPTSPVRPFSGVPVRQRQRLTAFAVTEMRSSLTSRSPAATLASRPVSAQATTS